MRFRLQSWQWECVCVTRTHCTRKAVYDSETTKDHTTISPEDQIPIFRYIDANRNTQSNRYLARNVKYIYKETKPIPFLEDWWRGEGENEDFVFEHGDFERGKKLSSFTNFMNASSRSERRYFQSLVANHMGMLLSRRDSRWTVLSTSGVDSLKYFS